MQRPRGLSPPRGSERLRLSGYGRERRFTLIRNDEHTLNTSLARCLRKKNPIWREPDRLSAESLGALEGAGRPDIFVLGEGGGPLVVETEYEPANTVIEDARSRLGRVAAETGQAVERAVAVCMPVALREAPETELDAHVEASKYRFKVISGASGATDAVAPPAQFPDEGWLEGGVDELAALLEVLAVSESAVARSTDVLETAVRQAASRLAAELTDKPAVLSDIAAKLFQDPGVQTERMAMAIVANACTFHAVVAGAHGIRTLAQLRPPGGRLGRDALVREWDAILRINYWPIFHIARELLVGIPSSAAAAVLEILARAADELAALGATSSHDLTGRMFQQLIQDRKFLATYYTRPESAALLSELAVSMLRVPWLETGMTSVRVGDLACGTGTLISAAYHALIGRHRRAGHDDREAHPTMMEKCLIAADIMPAATHLTASMLSSVHPTTPYADTQVFALPYGPVPGSHVGLGSLSLMSEKTKVLPLFGTGMTDHIKGLGGKSARAVSRGEVVSEEFALKDASLDLVIMNPPFPRATNHEISDEAVPSFAGFGKTKAEQQEMSRTLKELRGAIVRRRSAARRKGGAGAAEALPASNGNAGLGSNFLDLAHAKVRPGGVIALVLPAALTLGASWLSARRLLARHYEDIVIVSLAGARSEEKSFSADTGMAEVLLLARRRYGLGPEELEAAQATWVSLDSRPRTVTAAHQAARGIRGGALTDGVRSGRRFEILTGSTRIGTGIRASLRDGGCAGVVDLQLVEAAMGLRGGSLPLVRTGDTRPIPLVALGTLGERGPVDRDIGGRVKSNVKPRGPFRVVPIVGVPTFPILWGHAAARERRLTVLPDTMGKVRPGRQADASRVWETASPLHFNRDFRLNSQSLAACLTPDPAIGGTAWPSVRLTDPRWDRAMIAWANSTLGLLLFWWLGSTQQSGRARLTTSRLPDLPVLDLRRLTAAQLRGLERAFDDMNEAEFLPAHRSHQDPARIELDRLVFAEALGFDEPAMEQITLLRAKWCAEPSVHGGKKS